MLSMRRSSPFIACSSSWASCGFWPRQQLFLVLWLQSSSSFRGRRPACSLYCASCSLIANWSSCRFFRFLSPLCALWTITLIQWLFNLINGRYTSIPTLCSVSFNWSLRALHSGVCFGQLPSRWCQKTSWSNWRYQYWIPWPSYPNLELLQLFIQSSRSLLSREIMMFWYLLTNIWSL